MKRINAKLFLILGLLWAAQVTSARQFYLMTVEPGTEFWSVYGHTALVIDDDVYGFGVFSFEQKDFYQSFARNEMTYMVGHTAVEDEVYWAEVEGRKMTMLPLNISVDAQNEIMAYLRWHFKPENQSYAYDYFLQNCATKIRDILDGAMDGELQANFSNQGSGSYFSHTFPVNNQSLMTFGLAVAFGHAAYQPRTDWELMAFPMFLRHSLLQPGMSDWHGELEVKVNKSDADSWFQFLKTHLFLMLLTVLMLLCLGLKPVRKLTINVWLSVQSLVGVILLFLWFGTAHEMAAWNIQLLIFSPLAVAAIKFLQIRKVLWLFVILWVPLAIWQGSWYLWPLIVVNTWVLILMGRQLKTH
ncbi:DUF4105 domain-containing protein [Marinicella rhabdoformis]|uniref:lipoprotein N-acyltransferase Lnb domain-containing protein n=1 Tax=Marinicella rhabdoformis TaxID=2580566 RepID=UPI0012AEDFF2|nr:DUF4105 domain-containing protein [Marinicella rhabdoformis]